MSTTYAESRRAEREQNAERTRLDVLALHGEGLNPKEIAQRVQISKREVKEIVARG
jgi:DNA-directed RNA polymerase specialized sigma24 family protein